MDTNTTHHSPGTAAAAIVADLGAMSEAEMDARIAAALTGPAPIRTRA